MVDPRSQRRAASSITSANLEIVSHPVFLQGRRPRSVPDREGGGRCGPGIPGGLSWSGPSRPRHRPEPIRVAPRAASALDPRNRRPPPRPPRYRQILASLVRYGYRDVVTALHLDRARRPLRTRRWATRSRRRTGRSGSGWSARTSGRPSSSSARSSAPGPTSCPRPTRPSWPSSATTSSLPLLRGRGDPPRGVRPAGLRGLRLDRARAARLGLDLAGPPRHPPRRPARSRSRSAGRGSTRSSRPTSTSSRTWPNSPSDGSRSLVPYGPVALARELERTLKRELDLSIERRTMERCRGQFAREKTAHIPEVFREYSTSRSWRWS